MTQISSFSAYDLERAVIAAWNKETTQPYNPAVDSWQARIAVETVLASFRQVPGFVGFDVLDSQTYPDAGTHVVIAASLDEAVAGARIGEPFALYRKTGPDSMELAFAQADASTVEGYKGQ